MKIKMDMSVEGYFNLIVRDAKTLEIKRETGVFRNLITNYGLNRLGTGGVLNGATVGTGNSAPLVTDVSLQSPVASTDNIFTQRIVVSNTAPYYSARVRTYRFPEGAAAGNLSEVGVIANNESPFQLWSRSLILDTSGNPVTLTVLPNEILDVVYECRVYAMENDVSGGPVMLLGVPYNWTLRAINVTDDIASSFLQDGTVSISGATAYDGNMVPVTSSVPDGAAAGNSGFGVASAYANNSYKRQITYPWSVAQGNAASGIKTIVVPTISGQAPRFQLGLDKVFPKSSTNTLSIVFEYSWARRSI